MPTNSWHQGIGWVCWAGQGDGHSPATRACPQPRGPAPSHACLHGCLEHARHRRAGKEFRGAGGRHPRPPPHHSGKEPGGCGLVLSQLLCGQISGPTKGLTREQGRRRRPPRRAGGGNATPTAQWPSTAGARRCPACRGDSMACSEGEEESTRQATNQSHS